MKRDLHVRNFLFLACWQASAGARVLLICFLCLVSSPGKTQDVLWGLTSQFGPYGAGTAFSMQSTGAGYNLHKSFVNPPVHPQGSLVQGRDGNLYGMTSQGGSFKGGTVFKTSPAGAGFQVLKSLNFSDGVNPLGSLVQGTDGNFYGMTPFGGSFTQGTVFKVDAKGTGFEVLKNFSYDDGANPLGSLIQGNDGNFYGMTQAGGSAGGGTVFRINGAGADFAVIKHLAYTADGAFPRGNLVQGTDGLLYGMTQTGGSKGQGTIFRVATNGADFAVLKHFAYTDGANPQGSLVQGADGHFYGMTSQGGSKGYGTVFKISATGAGFAVLKNFDKAADGGHPFGSLVLGPDGHFYGMASQGGSNGYGTVFQIDAAGTGFRVLRNFAYADGVNLLGSLVLGADGNFYGMTYQGGSTGAGAVFRISPAGMGFSVINNLGTTDGANPLGSLVQGADGNFYGLTQAGGSADRGTVFRIDTNGKGYTVLKSFEADSDGVSPRGSLVQGSDGYFYGMTYAGGSFSQGTVFKIDARGADFTVLKHFAYTDGANPQGSLVLGGDGHFNGMTTNGGSKGYGTVFKIGATGADFAVLKSFDYALDGANPAGSLVQGTDGDFYGLTYQGGSNDQGTVFKISPTGADFTVLKHFAFTDGANPSGSLVQGPDGNFYGLAANWGSKGYGTVFKIAATGEGFAVLKSFDYATDGAFPAGSLVQGSDSAFYGMTYQGGIFGGGTVFKIGTTGSGFTVLKHFNSFSDGIHPKGSLLIQKSFCKPPRKIAVTGPAAPFAINTPIRLQVTFLGNAEKAAIQWGDGSALQEVAHPANTFGTPAHAYSEPGVYRVKITLTGCNARKQYVYENAVVYDPNGGFVLGGGWMISPPGAYKADTVWIGKAYFGFVSKYQKGATVPTGITEFRFQAAGFKFSSTSYDWLVVSGSKAQYKGKGTVNGVGAYAFLLSGVDGDRNAPQTPDRLRLKIWNTTTNALVYDNQSGEAADAAEPDIAGGAIVIHTYKKQARVAWEPEKPAGPASLNAYPNPFRTKTTVAFSFGKDEDYTLEVYDLKGSLVKRLQEGKAKAGNLLQLTWQPGVLPQGVYLIQLKTPSGVQQLRAVLE